MARVTHRSAPKQADRLTESLSDAQRHRDRQARAASRATGKLHADVEITAGADVKLQHSLGKTPTTWRAQRIRADAAITHHVPRETAIDATYLTLANDSTVDVTIDVWVE